MYIHLVIHTAVSGKCVHTSGDSYTAVSGIYVHTSGDSHCCECNICTYIW